MSGDGSVVESAVPGRAVWIAASCATVAIGCAAVVIVCHALASIFPLQGDDGIGTGLIFAVPLPLLTLLVLWGPWLLALSVPAWNARRDLILSLAAAQAAGVGAVFAAAPAGLVSFVEHVSDPRLDLTAPGDAIARAVLLCSGTALIGALAVLAVVRSGRSPLPLGGALLTLAAAGILFGLWQHDALISVKLLLLSLVAFGSILALPIAAVVGIVLAVRATRADATRRAR